MKITVWEVTAMKINPILKREIKSDTRSIRLFLSLMIYNLVLFLIFAAGLAIISDRINNYSDYYSWYGWYGDTLLESYSWFASLFPIIALVQCGILGLIIPIITASSISGEKERQTFDIMLTTAITPMGIVRGKVFTAVTKMMLYVITSIPIMSVSFIFGGIKWSRLFGFVVIMLVYGFFVGSIGVLCSAICKSSKASIILSFVYCGAVYVGTLIPLVVSSFLSYNSNTWDMGESLLFLLLNPAVMVEEFLFGNSSILSDLQENGGYINYGGITEMLLENNTVWIIVSIIMVILLSYLFMWLAAIRVNPLIGKDYRRNNGKAKK